MRGAVIRTNCQKNIDMVSSSEEEVKTIIQQFFSSMNNQDFKLMEHVVANDDRMVHIGTDKDEIWKGWDELHAATLEQFDGLEYYKAEVKDLQIHVSATGKVAWYSHLLDARIKANGNTTKWKEARFTGVLEKREGQWKLVQTHVSHPD